MEHSKNRPHAMISVETHYKGTNLEVRSTTCERRGAYVVDSQLQGLAYVYDGKNMSLLTPSAKITFSMKRIEGIIQELCEVLDDIAELKLMDKDLPNGKKRKEE